MMEGVGLGDAKIQLAVNADGTKILRVQADVTDSATPAVRSRGTWPTWRRSPSPTSP